LDSEQGVTHVPCELSLDAGDPPGRALSVLLALRVYERFIRQRLQDIGRRDELLIRKVRTLQNRDRVERPVRRSLFEEFRDMASRVRRVANEQSARVRGGGDVTKSVNHL